MVAGAGPMVLLTSWPYDEPLESGRKAKALFDQLRAASSGDGVTSNLPFGAAHEVALICAPSWWMVAVSGLPDKSGTLAEVDAWFERCGPKPEQPIAQEFQTDPEGDLVACVEGRFWGRVVDSFTAGAE